MIEVAIGEYGTDVLVKLADTTKITYIKDHNNCLLISGDQELQLENGAFTLYLLKCIMLRMIVMIIQKEMYSFCRHMLEKQ